MNKITFALLLFFTIQITAQEEVDSLAFDVEAYQKTLDRVK